MEDMKGKLDEKNTYMHYFKKEDVKQQDEHDAKFKTHYLYDMAKGDTDQNYC